MPSKSWTLPIFHVHREKQTTLLIHRLALLLLALLAGWNLFALITRPAPHWSLSMRLGMIGIVGSLWALAIWKIWTRPRAWGKGVGIAMLLIVVAHGFLWYRAVQYFRRMGQEMGFVPELLKFLPYEVLFGITGIVCLVLARRSAPQEVGSEVVRD